MKRTAKYANVFLAPVKRGLSEGITGQMLADEYTAITGQKIGKNVVYRWLLNRGEPVEPLLGSGLALKAAFERLKKRNAKLSGQPPGE